MAFTAPMSITLRGPTRRLQLTSHRRRSHTSPPVVRRATTATASPDPPDAPAPPAPEVPFPTLYDAWFPPDNQLATQMQAAVTRAHADGHTLLELQWPTVPNLEEIAAGTKLNFEFGKHVSRVLGMHAPPDYMLIKRYLAQFCNLYWALQVAQSDAFRARTVWAVSADGVAKRRAQHLRNVRLASLRDPPDPADDDVVVLLDPRTNDAWRRGVALRPPRGATVFLNSQFNESYGLTGPRGGALHDICAAYFLKRVTRGYAFYSYPGPWRACLERPDLGIETLARWDDAPSLRELAGVVRRESNNRYGGFYNDRYVRGFGGRL